MQDCNMALPSKQQAHNVLKRKNHHSPLVSFALTTWSRTWILYAEMDLGIWPNRGPWKEVPQAREYQTAAEHFLPVWPLYGILDKGDMTLYSQYDLRI